MKLLNIMLVDDEENVKYAIINKMDWQALGYNFVGDARNGEEALEKIEYLEPDVVLTDIRMPYMDGLELTEKLQKQYPSIKVVIFTGFDEFDYAKQAIHLNVMEYILKPVNMEELSNVLNKIRNNFLQQINERKDFVALREKYNQSLPLIKERFLTDLAQGNYNINPALAHELIERYDMKISGANRFMVATIVVNDITNDTGQNEEFSENKELINLSILKFLDKSFNEYMELETFRTAMGINIVFFLKTEQDYRQILDQLNFFCKEIHKFLGVIITIGVGSVCNTVLDISNSYEESKEAAGYYQIIGKGKTIYIADVEPIVRRYPDIDQNMKNEYVHAMKFGSTDAVINCVKQMVREIKEKPLHTKQEEMYYFSFVELIIQMVQRYELDERYILGTSKSFIDLLQQLMIEPDSLGIITKLSLRIHEKINQSREEATNELILKAKNFIQENYANPELTGEMVCKYLHISQAYFSTIFKKETGQSYVAYLTDIRMNKAVELLKETEEKTYIISEKVGYTESNYFSYVFKKKYGVAPSKYIEMVKGKIC